MEANSAFFLLAILALGAFLWVYWVEPNWFRLRRKIIRVPKPIGEPITILHLSDLHLSRRRPLLDRFFERLSRLSVDFVFLTGDLIDGREGIALLIENLKRLKPRKGTFAVLGNHDYRVYPNFDALSWVLFKKTFGVPRPEVEELKKALGEAGIRLLANENVTVPLSEGKEAVLVGVDDPVTGRADLESAFRGIEDGALHLALTHSPMVFPPLSRRCVDVAFAGHTHGGQIRVPGIGPLPLVYLREPVVDSTNKFGFVGLVSRGLGAQSRMRLRLFCRPEAVLVRIEGSESR